jgi:Plasmid encoded RepA protein
MKLKGGIALVSDTRLETPGGKLTPKQLKLIDTAAAIRTDPENVEWAFMARQLVQCTLPHRNPGNIEAWQRKNGNLSLVIRPGWNHDEQRSIGYPYGSIPRLLLFWIVTEAKRTHNRRLELGHSLADFGLCG